MNLNNYTIQYTSFHKNNKGKWQDYKSNRDTDNTGKMCRKIIFRCNSIQV